MTSLGYKLMKKGSFTLTKGKVPLSCSSRAVSHASWRPRSSCRSFLKNAAVLAPLWYAGWHYSCYDGSVLATVLIIVIRPLARSNWKEEGFILGQNSGKEAIIASQAWRQRKQVTSLWQSGNRVGPDAGQTQARYNLWGLFPSPHCLYLLIVSQLHKIMPQAGEQLFKQISPRGTCHIHNMVNGIL